MMSMKGLADEATKGVVGKKEEPTDPLEVAVSEAFTADDPKARAAAFRAAVQMCMDDYGGGEEQSE